MFNQNIHVNRIKTTQAMETNRIKIAVEFLKDGQSFKVGALRLGIDGNSDMYVTGWSQCSNIERLTQRQALKELNEIKALFKWMVDSSQELKDFIHKKTVKYNLAFDYGMGAIGVCSEKDGVVYWEMDIQE